MWYVKSDGRRVVRAPTLPYGATMSRPERPSLAGRPLPDAAPPDAHGVPFPLRGRDRPLALFFYIRNGTPG